jgi:hypothetical protein
MHIDFIQSSSSNDWIKLSFDSMWTLISKLLSCTFLKKFLYLKFTKDIIQILVYYVLSYLLYIIFLDKIGSPLMCFHPTTTI